MTERTNRSGRVLRWTLAPLVALAFVASGPPPTPAHAQAANPCATNPCAEKNPCAANPCAGKNPCAANPCAAGTNPCAANPCASKNPCAANPCASKNPCAANPCAGTNPCGANPCNPCGGGSTDASRFVQPKGVDLAGGSEAALLARGEALWNDPLLSGSGALSCATCHVGGTAQMNASFAEPYPHPVAMPQQAAGVAQVNAAEMVQFCMITPMANEPLPWRSEELAALTAYVGKLQKSFHATSSPRGGNPCGPVNPCNPCGD